MKRFTILSAAVAAMMSLSAFAGGTDVTDKLVNPNCDELLKGWDIKYDRANVSSGYNWLVSKHSEDWSGNYGYWGWQSPNFEMWNGNQAVVSKNSISQTVKNLPNGTYVFSAFCVFARSGYDVENPDDWKEAYGGYMFANEDSIAVATNVTGSFTDGRTWLHGRRFSVAATVTDGKLKVGLGAKAENNLFWLGFDGATLYSFGDVTTDEALVEMAKINLAKDVALAEEMMSQPLTADGAKAFAEAMPTAENATTIEAMEAATDAIRIACSLARPGMAALTSLSEQLATAKEVAESEWSDMVAQQVVNLKKKIAQVEADLTANTLNYDEIEGYKADFQEYIDQVRIDALWDAFDALSVFLDSPEEISEDEPCFGLTSHPGFGTEVGQYPLSQEESLRKLLEQVGALLADIEEEKVSASSGFAYVATIEGAVNACVAAVIKGASELPYDWILIPDPVDPTKRYNTTAGSCWADPYFSNFFQDQMLCGLDFQVMQFISPVIKLAAPVQEISISLVWGPRGGDMLIDEFYIFDADGNRINVPYENISFNFSGWYSSDGSWRGLIDDYPSNCFWQSGWSVGSDGYQTISFLLEEPISEFYLALENLANEWRLQCNPFEIIVNGKSQAVAELMQAIKEANSLGTFYVGTDPGFYTSVPGNFEEAKAKAQELLNNGGTDAELVAATDVLLAAIDQMEELTPNGIKEGVEYMIPNAFAGYHQNGGHRKVMTVLQDSILWWDSADPADKNQRWIFEKVDASDLGDGYVCYNVKNVGTGKYLARFVRSGEAWEPTGEEILWGNPAYVKLGEEPCRWDVPSLGYGQWGLRAEIGDGGWYMCHTCNHNGGVPTTTYNTQGGSSAVNPNGYSINGVCGPIVQWNGTANSASAWYIWSEIESVPLAAAAAGKMIHFATATSVYSLTADKNCAFDDLHFYSLEGAELPYNVKKTTNSVIVQFSSVICDFSYTFNNAEGASITIDASTFEKTKYELLQEAYNAVKNDFTEGPDVGNMKSLKDYNAAIEKADYLLENGGTDEELAAAAEALYAAYDALEMVLPEEGKTYVIYNVNDQWMNNYGKESGIYNNMESGQAGYDFLDDQDPAFQWQFVNVPEKGPRHYYIKSVADGKMIGYQWAFETCMPMTTDSCSYEVINNGTLNSVSFHGDHSGDINFSLHNPCRGTFGPMLYWGPAAGGSRFFVKEVVDEETRVYELKDLVEPCTPIQHGTYDLTGRRVVMPERGLYIIDGKKKIIK